MMRLCCAGQRVKPARYRLGHLVRRAGHTGAQPHHAVRDGEQVLDPMVQLTDKQMLNLFRLFTLVDVDKGDHDPVDDVVDRALGTHAHDVSHVVVLDLHLPLDNGEIAQHA